MEAAVTDRPTRRSRRRTIERLLALGVLTLSAGCEPSVTKPSSTLSLTGDWEMSVSAYSCSSGLPFYGVAPHGGGTATIVQSGNQLSGDLYIFGTPAGTLRGTIADNHAVAFEFHLDGENRGVLSPADTPCRVVGTGTGTANQCSIGVPAMTGEFACPHLCSDAKMSLGLMRGLNPHTSACDF